MKTRKISLGHRCTVTLLVLLFGVLSPIGCAQTPKNLFSKVWGPDRITFKEAVGLDDSRSKKKTNPIFAGKLRNKSGTNQSSKLAQNDGKTIGEKVRDFGKVLTTGFNRNDKNNKSVVKTASKNSQTKTRIKDARTRLASSNSPNRDLSLRNLGKTSAAETLRKNRLRNDLRTKKTPTQSLYASRSARRPISSGNTKTNPFAEFLETQEPDGSRRNVPSANTKTQGNTIAQSDNPFANSRNQTNPIAVNERVKESTGSPSDNQFVAEFDNSWDKILREQAHIDDDDSDETDELDELDEFDETLPAQRLASSSFGNTALKETLTNQQTNLGRHEKNRERVDRLMQSAHSELAKGRSVDALNYARNAEEFAANEGVFFGPKEEHSGELVRSIRGQMGYTLSQAENVPPPNPVIVPHNRKNTTRDTGNSSQRTENTKPFAELKPSERRFAALPQPPENTASAPTSNAFRALENSNGRSFEPRIDETRPPSYAELQTVIVEVSDPFDGMIVESESVPPRIPKQSDPQNADSRPVIRSADAQANKYRGPKTIPQNVLNRLRSSTPRPPEVDKKRAVQEQHSRSRKNSNRNSSQEKKPKRVNSNRGARIITSNYEVPLELENIWRPLLLKSKKQKPVKTAQWTVVKPEQAEEQKSVEVAAEQPLVAPPESSFFQIGGSSGEKKQKSASLVDWNAETGYKAGSQNSDLRDRYLIIVCIAIAGLIGFGIRRRDSLRLLRKKFASR